MRHDSIDKCQHCPVRNLPLPCPAITRAHFRFCALVNPDRPDFDPAYAPLIESIAGLPQSIPMEAETPRPGLEQTLGRLARVKTCPHRATTADCGCGGLAACGLGKGRQGIVNQLECLECVRAGEEENRPGSEESGVLAAGDVLP